MTTVRELAALPELGVGCVYWPSLEEFLDGQENLVDVIEVEPQPFWFAPESPTSAYRLDSRAFEHLRGLSQPKLVHGVGFPVGGTAAPGAREVAAFVESIDVLGAVWASEHLSFNRVHRARADIDVGFLLPPVQSAAGVALAAKQIATLQTRLGVPFAFETGVSYLRPLAGELSDGAFFAAVARAADCGILLDLHNVWTNECNGRQPVLELIEELPLERVVELHLAGGQEFDGYWVDAHSDLIPSSVLDLARGVIPRLPNLKAIIYEVMPEYVEVKGISSGQLADQFCHMRELWDLRGRETRPLEVVPMAAQFKESASLPTPGDWEDALAAAVTIDGVPGDVGLLGDLRKDPGTAVLRQLIRAVRAGKVAGTLPLTTRLLLLTIGEQALQDLFDEFWDVTPSQQMASDEALGFGTYLASSVPRAHVPYLHDVAAFELAAHQAIMSGEAQNVEFSCDPGPLLRALRDGRLPPTIPAGRFAATVSAPDG